MPKSALSPISKFEPLPRFVTGSIFRHIAVMTGTSAIGLMAIFVSDFANIFFLGLLGDLQLLAAVGYASSIMFFLISAGIGMSIAVVALVSPALGARDIARARRLSSHAAVFAGATSSLLVAVLWPALPALLGSLEGRRTHAYARTRIPRYRAAVVAAACAGHVCLGHAAIGRRGATCDVHHPDGSCRCHDPRRYSHSRARALTARSGDFRICFPSCGPRAGFVARRAHSGIAG